MVSKKKKPQEVAAKRFFATLPPKSEDVQEQRDCHRLEGGGEPAAQGGTVAISLPIKMACIWSIVGDGSEVQLNGNC